MLPLGILAIISGFFEHGFHSFVTKLLPDYTFNMEHNSVMLMVLATISIATFGIVFALYIYIKRGGFSPKIENTFIYKFLSNQYYIPHIYQKYVVEPFILLADFAYKQVDAKIIDRSVDLIAKLIHKTGDNARAMQSGNLSGMLRWMVFGLIALLLFALIYKI
jgi:NADH-quinone oxidoreductase subunit L